MLADAIRRRYITIHADCAWDCQRHRHPDEALRGDNGFISVPEPNAVLRAHNAQLQDQVRVLTAALGAHLPLERTIVMPAVNPNQYQHQKLPKTPISQELTKYNLSLHKPRPHVFILFHLHTQIPSHYIANINIVVHLSCCLSG